MIFKPLLPIVEYVVNYDYITKVLCVNKENLVMGCDGKCYLVSQLAKASDFEKPITDKRIVVKDFEIIFYQAIPEIVLSPLYLLHKTTANFNYCNRYASICGTAVFHPPTLFI